MSSRLHGLQAALLAPLLLAISDPPGRDAAARQTGDAAAGCVARRHDSGIRAKPAAVRHAGGAPRSVAPDDHQLREGLRRDQQAATELLKRATAPPIDPPASAQLLTQAAEHLERLANAAAPAGAAPGSAEALLPADLSSALRDAASRLRAHARSPLPSSFAAAPVLDLLERVGRHLASDPLADLAFQGSYSATAVAEPVYGGHGAAMGPPPEDPPGGAKVASPVQFEEVPGIATKTFCGGRAKDHILESGGSGVALLDYDGDGWLDVYLVTAFELDERRERIPHRSALFRNLGGWKFQDVSAGSGLDVAAWGSGVCAGDYDSDGRLDLYVTNFGPNFLFRNNGDGTFTDGAAVAGVQAPGWSTGCTFFDADADGDLDLYVVGYVSTSWNELATAQRTLTWRGGPKTMVGPKGLTGEADLFFENRGDGTFAEATAGRGLTDAARAYGFGVVATDYDDDGWVDLFVANDTMPNFLYRNLGDGRFESVGLASGVALNAEGRAQAGMGVDSGDHDGDGRLDLVVTNFAHDTNTLYRNRDGQQFDDVTATVGLASATFVRMGWGTVFLDADLDGRLDLFVANGHIYPNVDEYPELQESFRQTSQLFLNRGGRFADVSETAGGGLRIARVSRGLAAGDLDNDGDLDLVLSNMDAAPAVLENRQRTGHHWVAVAVEQPGRNRFGIGARITVEGGDGTRQIREIRSGGSYLSQGDLRAYFGLGSYSGRVDVEVRMPGGARWRWQQQPVDRLLTLTLEDAYRIP